MRSKKRSIKRYLLIGGIGGSVLLLLLLLCFGGYIILQYRHVYKRDHEIMTSDYAQPTPILLFFDEKCKSKLISCIFFLVYPYFLPII